MVLMIVFSSIYKVPDNIVDAAIVFGTLAFLNGLFLEGRNKKDKEQSL
jgi:hypothetical protein